MRRLILVLALAAAAGGPPALAQSTAPDSENGRYTFNTVADGLLRLDTRTGQVSLCAQRPEGWACEVVADDGRLTEAQVEPPRRPRREPELKRVMAFIETVWRRVVALVGVECREQVKRLGDQDRQAGAEETRQSGVRRGLGADRVAADPGDRPCGAVRQRSG